MANGKKWTEGERELLKKLFNLGVTLTKIGERLGVSDNSVAGQVAILVKRGELTNRVSPIGRGYAGLGLVRKSRSHKKKVPVEPQQARAVVVEIKPGPVHPSVPYVLPPATGCMWFNGKRPKIGWTAGQMCCKPVVDGRWCAEHHHRVYIKRGLLEAA